jgi:hypothetical protein
MWRAGPVTKRYLRGHGVDDLISARSVERHRRAKSGAASGYLASGRNKNEILWRHLNTRSNKDGGQTAIKSATYKS